MEVVVLRDATLNGVLSDQTKNSLSTEPTRIKSGVSVVMKPMEAGPVISVEAVVFLATVLYVVMLVVERS